MLAIVLSQRLTLSTPPIQLPLIWHIQCQIILPPSKIQEDSKSITTIVSFPKLLLYSMSKRVDQIDTASLFHGLERNARQPSFPCLTSTPPHHAVSSMINKYAHGSTPISLLMMIRSGPILFGFHDM